MPCTTARALHVRLCSEFTALGHVQWKKIEINFFGPFSSLFHPFSRHCFPRDLKVTHPRLERLESDSSKSWETWKWLIQVSRDLKVTHPSLERLENDSSKSWETWKWLIKTRTPSPSLNLSKTLSNFLCNLPWHTGYPFLYFYIFVLLVHIHGSQTCCFQNTTTVSDTQHTFHSESGFLLISKSFFCWILVKKK
jgi:hypothetical protein